MQHRILGVDVNVKSYRENHGCKIELNSIHQQNIKLHELFLSFIYMLIVHTTVYVWRSEDDLQRSFLSFHHVGF